MGQARAVRSRSIASHFSASVYYRRLYGVAGSIYFLTALVSGLAFLGVGIYLARTRSVKAARYVLYASLLYLPLVFITMALDKI